jgi:hypothetical protein
MKVHLYKHRTAAHVRVPLATPEIIEFNEITGAPFSVQEHYDTSSPIKNNTDESINDLSKQTRGKFLVFISINKILFF